MIFGIVFGVYVLVGAIILAMLLLNREIRAEYDAFPTSHQCGYAFLVLFFWPMVVFGED